MPAKPSTPLGRSIVRYFGLLGRPGVRAARSAAAFFAKGFHTQHNEQWRRYFCFGGRLNSQRSTDGFVASIATPMELRVR